MKTCLEDKEMISIKELPQKKEVRNFLLSMGDNEQKNTRLDGTPALMKF